MHNVWYQLTVFLVFIDIIRGFSAACDISDVTVVISGNQAESETWLATLGKTGKRPLHMNFHDSYGDRNFTGISITDNNSGWAVDWGRSPTSYKTSRCARWNSAHYPTEKAYTVIEMSEACSMNSFKASASDAFEFEKIASELKSNGSLLKSVVYGNYKFHGIWDKAPAGAAPIKDLLLLDLRPVEMESQLEKQTAAGMKLQQLFSYQWTAWTYYGAYLTAGIPEHYEVQANKSQLAAAIKEQRELGRVPTMITGVNTYMGGLYFTAVFDTAENVCKQNGMTYSSKGPGPSNGQPAPPAKGGIGGISIPIIAGAAAGGLLLLAILGGVALYLTRRQKKPVQMLPPPAGSGGYMSQPMSPMMAGQVYPSPPHGGMAPQYGGQYGGYPAAYPQHASGPMSPPGSYAGSNYGYPAR